MDKTELEAIRARCEAAHRSPWLLSGFLTVTLDNGYLICDSECDEDAEFIANARQDVPALLDALDVESKLAQETIEISEDRFKKLTAVISDRNLWQARAEALERVLIEAVKGKCDYCKHRANPEIAGTCIFLKTDDSCWGGEKWELDESRFAQEADNG